MTTKPPTFPIRQETTQQVTYVRSPVFNFSDTGIASAVQFASIPLKSVILRANVCVVTAFNAASTNVVTVGVTKASANELVGSSDVTEGTPAMYYGAAANLGTVNTGTASAEVGAENGGVGLWYKYTQTGTAATTGSAFVVVEFIAPSTTDV